MRCAVDFDENKALFDQEIKAWGEMQSLEEEPCYKESDIKDEREKEFFNGYKFAFDTVCNLLESSVFDETISEDVSEHLQICMSGELAMMLFSILDNQYCEDDEE